MSLKNGPGIPSTSDRIAAAKQMSPGGDGSLRRQLAVTIVLLSVIWILWAVFNE